ncbi:cytochrome c oxidase assembly protein [Nitrobacter sp.]|uniref:cytochrome c oxidase assembly protein n=1 Tax=Nitrobacter sp. TaxID=29420 RepID=UPI00399D749E
MTGAPHHPQQPVPTTSPATPAAPKAARRVGRDVKIGAACGLLVALMIGAAYAAVPFYNWFCRATGFNGTTQVANVAPKAAPLSRTVAVRFDSNISSGLPWKFAPEQTEINVRIGEVATVYYTVTSTAAAATTGQAAYNVTPLTVGSYFTKINCFCFTEQTLAAGEKREMAVVFYVDPAFAADSENDGVNTITLSYTFFPVKDAAPKPVAAGEPDRPGGSGSI